MAQAWSASAEDAFEASPDDKRLDVVYDGTKDIVKNDLLVRYRSGASGRKRFDKIYVRKGPKGKGWTTINYDPAKDKPDTPIPILPTKAEEEGRPNTVPALVVGLALADDPYKHNPKTVGTSRNAQVEKDRSLLPILESDASFLRVVVPLTDYIHPQIKYYVACHQVHDLCDLRLANQQFVFFFDEFWTGIDVNSQVKSRRTELGKACRTAAATNKKPEERAQISVQADPASARDNIWTPSSLLSISPASNLARTLTMQLSLYTINPQTSILSAARAMIEDSIPDIKNTPFGTSNVGTATFYDFDEPLNKENAGMVVRELQAIDSTLYKDINADMVVKIHSALKDNNLHGRLTYQGFGIFLEACHRKCRPEWDSAMILTAVENILEDHEKIFAAGFSSTTSNLKPSVAGGTDSFTTFLASFRELLICYDQYLLKYAQKMREQHGALDNSITFENLMNRIGNCVDTTAFKALFEQGMGLHADQWTSAHMHAHDYAQELIKHINTALGGEEDQEDS